jgi:hypothetical protein
MQSDSMYFIYICLDTLTKATETLYQISKSQDQDLKLRFNECLLPTLPRLSVALSSLSLLSFLLYLVLPSSTYLFTAGVQGFCDFN